MRELPMKIYDNSPIYLQNLLTTIEGYRKTKSRYGHIYFEFLRALGNRRDSDKAAGRTHQQEEMQKLIAYAVDRSPFYQEFYKGIDLKSIRTVEDLKKLPVLEMDMLQKNIASFYTLPESAAVVSYILDHSGMPLKFLITKEDMQRHMAFLDFFKNRHGATNLEMKRASFSSNRFIPKRQRKKVYWRDNHSAKQRLYSSYYCNKKNAGAYVENLDTYKPDFIDGLPSAICELAKYINQNKIILSFQPIAIFTTEEKLTPECRKEIEAAFDSPVHHHFAFTEGAPFIAECAKGKMHYNPGSGIIEATEDKEMIITGFNTYGTPLIRYKTGERIDLAIEEERCACGSAHPVLRQLQGREEDFLQSQSRGKFTALYMSMAGSSFSSAIRKIQFSQTEPDAIDVMIEAAESYTAAMTESIQEELVYIFGEDMKYHIRIVEEIPPNKKNKFRLVINNVN